MAPPPAKKQRTDPRAPIVFTTSDIKPDVRFRVFNQEYHVYSGVLKINSAFFRKFLEPSGGKLPTSSLLFQSEWFTQIDDDGNFWSLTSEQKFRDADLSTFRGSPEAQEKGFHKLLCALFSRSYNIGNVDELFIMTNLADYYRALPILSNSLWGPLVNSLGLVPSIKKDPCTALTVAYKLRHKQLFNDSFIQVLGPWQQPCYRQLSEPKLLEMAANEHFRMCAELLKVQQGIFRIFADKRDTGKRIVEVANAALDKSGNVLLPEYFRLCYNSSYKNYDGKEAVQMLLGPLLKSNLALDKSGKAGEGDFKDFFLSFEVKTYPWDESQHDW